MKEFFEVVEYKGSTYSFLFSSGRITRIKTLQGSEWLPVKVSSAVENFLQTAGKIASNNRL